MGADRLIGLVAIMTGPIARAVMASINCDEFVRYPEFADWEWLNKLADLAKSDRSFRVTAAQYCALAGVTPDHSDFCEMGYYVRARASGQLSDSLRASGILRDAEKEVTL